MRTYLWIDEPGHCTRTSAAGRLHPSYPSGRERNVVSAWPSFDHTFIHASSPGNGKHDLMIIQKILIWLQCRVNTSTWVQYAICTAITQSQKEVLKKNAEDLTRIWHTLSKKQENQKRVQKQTPGICFWCELENQNLLKWKSLTFELEEKKTELMVLCVWRHFFLQPEIQKVCLS